MPESHTKTIKRPVSNLIFTLLSSVTLLIGVTILNWTLYGIIYLIWIDSVFLTVFTILKMKRAGRASTEEELKLKKGVYSTNGVPVEPTDQTVIKEYRNTRLLLLVVYWVFIQIMFGFMLTKEEHVIRNIQFFMFADAGMWLSIFSLTLQYASDYFKNYMQTREYENTSRMMLFNPMDKRSITLHVGIIGSGFLYFLKSEKFTASDPYLMAAYFFIILKMLVDTWAWYRGGDIITSPCELANETE